MEELLRIGAFARLANVTVKTLRFYADQGLLAPHHVDGRTGYRYYTAAQIPQLTKILNLREAGFSLAEIRGLAGAEASVPSIEQAIEAQRQLLLRQKAYIESRLKVVESLARSVREGGRTGLSQVRLAICDPQLAYTVRRRVPTLGGPVTRLFERAEANVAAFDARAQRNPFLLFYDEDASDTDIDLEVCIPVKDTAPPELSVRVVPGEDLSCSLIYTGPYSQTEHARTKLSNWLHSAGLRGRGPLREIYHRFGAQQDGYTLPRHMLAAKSSDYVTELQVGVTVHDTQIDGGDTARATHITMTTNRRPQ